MTQPARRTALITGASAGIGAALARVFAERGFDLVLVADLADPAAPARIFEKCRAGDRAIDVLVNNAGYGLGGKFLDSSWEQHARFIQVMMTAVTELTYRFLPGMIERGYGRIINVASLAGLVPGTAGHTLYGASKAYLIKFSESVALETVRHGVHVTAFCPGFTHTEFHDVSGTRDLVSGLPGFLWMEADDVARDGYEAVMHGNIVRVPGRVNRTLAVLARIMPQRLVMAVAKRQARKYRKVASSQ